MRKKRQKTAKISGRRGFTLIELMVAISIFTLLLGASMGAIIGMVDANRKAQSLKSVINNLNIAVDSMSRDMVVGRVFSVTQSGAGHGCIGHDDTQIEFTKGGQQISYRINIVESGGGECYGSIERDIDGSEDWARITAPEVRVENLRFDLSGSGQPRVLFLVEGQAGERENVVSDFRIQTTASQRSPEF